MGVGCCACADRRKNDGKGDSVDHSKDTLNDLLVAAQEKSGKSDTLITLYAVGGRAHNKTL